VRQCLQTVAANEPILHPQVIYEHEDPWWNDTGREKPKNCEKNPVPVTLCLPQIQHGLTGARTQAFALTGRRLSAWATAWSQFI
jgi:hypothetical protein